MSAVRWVTDDDLRDARLAFAAQIDGWVEPEAHGLVSVSVDGVRTLEVANVREHRLPAVVLALVIGRVSGTATWTISLEDFARAEAILTPAQYAVHMEHPNLAAWRRLLAAPPAAIEAVFIDDLSDPVTGEADQLIRAALR